MAQDNSIGGGKGGGGGGGPISFGCTLTVGTVYNDLITGVSYIIHPSSDPAPSGYQMCSSFYTNQWTPIPGTSPLLYQKGCCRGVITNIDNTGGGAIGDGNGNGVNILDPQLDVIDLFVCPDSTQIFTDIIGNVFYTTNNGGNGSSLPEECCNRNVVGADVVWVPSSALCRLLQNSCPPVEAISIVDSTILGIESPNCCTPEITGVPNVYWDSTLKQCRIPLIISSDCIFEGFITEPANIHDRPNVEQVFGTISNLTESLSQVCCTNEIVGFDVLWNSELGICEKNINLTPGGSNSVNITLNSEPIIIEDCDDLVVSAKIFFTQPSESCFVEYITASLLPDNPNIIVSQLGVFDSSTDGFNTWVDVTARFTFISGDTFNLNLNIGGGIVPCCEYDVRVDNIRIDCYKEEERLFFDTKKCVGFDLARVIDNKRSWVYNPGLEGIGESTQDGLIRDRGDLGLLEEFGYVNRKFAPSPDADIPWRYTDYYEQSNILEPHSNSVIISKEMELTFNMCSDCCVSYSSCPSGYSLSANTNFCYKIDTYCPSGYTLSAGTCYSGITTASTIVETVTASTGSYCTQTATLLQLEEYKKVFQSFWVRMIEQFVPATTIFVSGEKWCNNDTFICSEFNICDYDFEYVESEITVIEYGTDFVPYTGFTSNGGDVGSDNGSDTTLSGTSTGTPHDSNDGPIIIEGTTVIPVSQDPTGGGGITTVKNVTLTPPQLEPLLKQKQEYYNNIFKGGVKEIFV